MARSKLATFLNPYSNTKMIHYEYGKLLCDFYETYKSIKHINNSANKKAAFIVETRPAFFLPHVLVNAAYYLKNEWNLYIFHSSNNEQFLLDHLKEWGVNMININSTKVSQHDYSRLLKTEMFWNYFHEDHVLAFQLDTLFCRPISGEFLKYDYIGAPCGPNMSVMNGGFSLRKREFMIRAIRECNSCVNEDIEDFYFTRAAQKLNAVLSDFQTACRFSLESILTEIPVGVHGTDNYYTTTDQVAEVTSYVRSNYLRG